MKQLEKILIFIKHRKIIIYIVLSFIVLSVIICILYTKKIIVKICNENVLCYEGVEYDQYIPTDIIEKRKSAYILFPSKIQTDLGNIYLAPFIRIELYGINYGKSYLELRKKYYNNMWKHDLVIFGNKIENIYFLEINDYRLYINICQKLIINGEEYLVNYINYFYNENIIRLDVSGYSYYFTLKGD